VIGYVPTFFEPTWKPATSRSATGSTTVSACTAVPAASTTWQVTPTGIPAGVGFLSSTAIVFAGGPGGVSTGFFFVDAPPPHAATSADTTNAARICGIRRRIGTTPVESRGL
jgi:hypothetical protein